MADDFQTKQLNREIMRCRSCSFIYDPKFGDPESNIDPWTEFNDIPENWVCPICDGSKEQFELYTESEILKQEED